jgi:hypothetical protein
MEYKLTLIPLDLQAFAEGAGSGASAGGTGGAEGATGATATAAVSQTKGAKSNPLANVVYGKQESVPAAGGQTETTDADGNTSQTVDRNAEFEKLIKGEYKDLYDARMQDTVQKRLKGSKETVEKYEALSPVLEILAKKYGVDPSDSSALAKAIEDDDSYFEEEALEKGITVQQLQEYRKMERENADLRKQVEAEQNKEKANRLYQKWMNEAEQTRSVYPAFNLQEEMRNPQFVQLLRSDIPVRTAFEVIHKDEIIPAAMQYTAKAVEQKVANKIIANGARPTENGTSGQSAALTKSDVSQLTKEDRREIARRVARGEKIVF